MQAADWDGLLVAKREGCRTVQTIDERRRDPTSLPGLTTSLELMRGKEEFTPLLPDGEIGSAKGVRQDGQVARVSLETNLPRRGHDAPRLTSLYSYWKPVPRIWAPTW